MIEFCWYFGYSVLFGYVTTAFLGGLEAFRREELDTIIIHFIDRKRPLDLWVLS